MQLWTSTHARTLLPAVAVMLLLGFGLRKLLGNRDRRVRMIPLQIVAVLFVVLEIGKQWVSASDGYDLYHLPFHFCSLVVFAVPVMAFYRGRHTQKVNAVVSSICASVFLLMMIYPVLIYSEANIQEFFANYLSFHTVAFHNLVVFAFVLILALRLYEPAPKGEAKAVLWFMVGFCVVSAAMAQLLKTNFNNFYSCNIGPLETLRCNVQGFIGYGLTQLLYVLIVSALNILFLQMAHRLVRLVTRKKAGKEVLL